MLLKFAAVATTACTLVATTSPPVHATGPTARITSVAGSGCASGVFLMRVRFDGVDPAAPVVVHTIVRAGGLVYMDDGVPLPTNAAETLWRLLDSFNYGDVPNRGTWPIPETLPVRVEMRMERPKGTVLDSWSLSLDSCNQAKVLYNGLTANDKDEDNVPIPTDRCPAVEGNGFANGCPLYDRALTISYKKRAGRFVGRLGATDPGHRLRRGMPVTVWRARPGPDRRIGKDLTGAYGRYAVARRAKPGRYYATAPGILVPRVGAVLSETSQTVRVRRR
jgi:hypothetical protein